MTAVFYSEKVRTRKPAGFVRVNNAHALAKNLVVKYLFNQDYIADSSIYRNDGTRQGISTLPTIEMYKGFKALHFDISGTDEEYVDAGNNPSVDITGDKLTIRARVMPEAAGSDILYVCSKGQPWVDSTGYAFYRYSDNNLYFDVYTSGSTKQCTHTTAINNSSLHWIEAVYDGSDIWIEVDGVAGSKVSCTGDIVSSSENLSIGRQNASGIDDGYWSGFLETFEMYNDDMSSFLPSLRGNTYQTLETIKQPVFFVSSGGVTLVVQGLSHAQAMDSPALTQANTIVVQALDHAQNLDSPALTQANTLAVDELAHSQTMDSPSLTQANVLVVAELDHVHTIENVVLDQSSLLIVQDLLHTFEIDSVALTQDNVLAVQEMLHSMLMDSPALTQANTLSVNALDHTQTMDNVTLSLAGVLEVQELNHLFSMDNVDLVQANVLTVQDLGHVQSMDGVTLSIGGVSLIVQALDHAQSIDNVSLTQSQLLEVQSAVHAVLMDSPSLTQASTLVVSDLLHALLIDQVDFNAGIIRTPNEKVFIVQRKDRTFIVARNERNFTIK